MHRALREGASKSEREREREREEEEGGRGEGINYIPKREEKKTPKRAA